MNSLVNQQLLDQVMDLCIRAGEKILEVYGRTDGFAVEIKSDNSPVTDADLAANTILVEGLNAITPNIPVLSEEGGIPEFSQRQAWSHYWLVDPLDGTKEFINRNGEFTVNVALVAGGVPVLGVVHVPVSGVTYTGLAGGGAQRHEGDNIEDLSVRTLASRKHNSSAIAVVASSRHGAEAVERLCERIRKEYGVVDCKSIGSSLKLCLVAAGQADIYPRLSPTSEWDTAAAQAVVEAAGGSVLDLDLQALRYNQKESILTPGFYVLGDNLRVWEPLLSSVHK